MNGLNAGGIVARFAGALVLILATYNPEERSYFHWVYPAFPSFDGMKAFGGGVLLIGWTIFLRAATRLLGVFGFVLASGFFGALIWMGIDFGVIAQDNPRLLTYVSLVAFASVLTTGMIGSRVRGELSGQVDVDDLDPDRQ